MIKNIIFDFGDVFLDLDKAATERALRKHGRFNFSDQMLRQNQDYEKGLVTSEDFVAGYCRSFPTIKPESFIDSWNAILVDFPLARLKFLQNLAAQGKFRLFLLSNTNELHIEWVKRNIGFFADFKKCFEAFYLSQEIKLRKPDRAVFEYVLSRHNLIPEETIFIDDTPENTEAAEQLGIHTWTIQPDQEDVTDLFRVKAQLF